MTERELIEWAVKIIEQNVLASTGPETDRNQFLAAAREYLGVKEQEQPATVVTTPKVNESAKKNGPNVGSAATVARVISRMLRKNGFQMADTSNSSHWTEGFYVYRIGCSNNVSVSYHSDHEDRGDEKYLQARERARDRTKKAKEFLIGKGYMFNEMGYVECLRS